MSTSILVTAKINPDLDGIACAYAYSQLLRLQGKKATGGIFGHMHAEAAYLVNHFKIDDVVHDPTEFFDAFILVDASDMAGMPSVIRPEAVTEVIDHREVHTASQLFLNAKIQIEPVGSAATLIVEKYRSSQQSIDLHSAILLYGAIYSNTLNFQASIATERDKAAADWLQSQAEIPAALVGDMFKAKTRFASENLADALAIDTKQLSISKYKIGIAQLEILDLQQLAVDRIGDILIALEHMKDEHRLDMSLLTAIDLKNGFNLFITSDAELQSALSKALKVTFKNNIAKRGGLLLRKQLIPLLKSALEH
jgi:manganese-dependent inorganic pyrophosphatase